MERATGCGYLKARHGKAGVGLHSKVYVLNMISRLKSNRNI